MNTDRSNNAAGLAGPGVMLVSAAIFGYFGFGVTWLTTSGINGQFLPYVAIFEWTLKIGAIVFLLSGLLTFMQPLAGNALYAVASVLSAIAMAIVLVLDFMDKQHRVMPEIVLLILVVWNLYGSWSSMREVLAVMRSRPRTPRDERFLPPDG
jgi:hypothetical protein